MQQICHHFAGPSSSCWSIEKFPKVSDWFPTSNSWPESGLFCQMRPVGQTSGLAQLECMNSGIGVKTLMLPVLWLDARL